MYASLNRRWRRNKNTDVVKVWLIQFWSSKQSNTSPIYSFLIFFPLFGSYVAYGLSFSWTFTWVCMSGCLSECLCRRMRFIWTEIGFWLNCFFFLPPLASKLISNSLFSFFYSFLIFSTKTDNASFWTGKSWGFNFHICTRDECPLLRKGIIVNTFLLFFLLF